MEIFFPVTYLLWYLSLSHVLPHSPSVSPLFVSIQPCFHLFSHCLSSTSIVTFLSLPFTSKFLSPTLPCLSLLVLLFLKIVLSSHLPIFICLPSFPLCRLTFFSPFTFKLRMFTAPTQNMKIQFSSSVSPIVSLQNFSQSIFSYVDVYNCNFLLIS